MAVVRALVLNLLNTFSASPRETLWPPRSRKSCSLRSLRSLLSVDAKGPNPKDLGSVLLLRRTGVPWPELAGGECDEMSDLHPVPWSSTKFEFAILGTGVISLTFAEFKLVALGRDVVSLVLWSFAEFKLAVLGRGAMLVACCCSVAGRGKGSGE